MGRAQTCWGQPSGPTAPRNNRTFATGYRVQRVNQMGELGYVTLACSPGPGSHRQKATKSALPSGIWGMKRATH